MKADDMKVLIAVILSAQWLILVNLPSLSTAALLDPGQAKVVPGPRKEKPPPPPSPQAQPPPSVAATKAWEEPAVGGGGLGRRQIVDTNNIYNSNSNSNNNNNNNNNNNQNSDNRSNSQVNQDRYYVPSNCSRCRLHEAAINLTKEAIKQQILSKLGMQRAPNITGKVLPTNPTINHLLEVHGMQSDQATSPFQPGPEFDESEDDYHSQTQLIMIMAREPPRFWQFPAEINVQYFSLTSGSAASIEHVVYAKLWLYVKAPKTLEADNHFNVIVHHVMRASEGTGPLLSHFATKTVVVEGRGKWVYLGVEKLVIDWMQYPNRNFGVVIQAFDRKGRNLVNTDSHVANGSLIPYIEIHTMEERKRRRKRMIGLNCEENSNEVRCCRYPLTVDFEEFGWDWIIAPKKYEANYCSGECPFVFLQKYPHTHLVQQANPSGSAGPCCAPRKMSSISMLYFDDNNNIIYGLLPGMVVDRCGCS